MPPFFKRILLLVALLWAPVSVCVAETKPPIQVGRWARFEDSLVHEKPYVNPFRDVSLEVAYTAPDGRTIKFWGFYDGDHTWRFRFMPDTLGTWRYHARLVEITATTPSAVPTDTRVVASREGTFDCVPLDLPGQISVHSANPQWFGWRDGEAVLLRPLHIGDRFFAENWEETRRSAFLDWADDQGYNTLSIASHLLNRAVPGRGEGWDTPRLWPLDPAEYRRMERILAELERRRMIVYPFAGFFGREASFPGGHAEQTRYLRYTLARLAPHWNLLWNVGGPEPLLHDRTFLTFEEINRLGAQIARLDVFRHPLSVHNGTGDDRFKDQPWLSYGTLQGPKTFDRAQLRDGLLRNHHPAKPLLAQETLWSGNSIHIRDNKGVDYSDADLRKNAFVIHFCAAYFVFADNRGDSSTGFTGTLDLADRRQDRHDIVKRVWDTVAALPWANTLPRPDLVTVRSGQGHAFCLAAPGRVYLVYLESPLKVSVAVAEGEQPYRVEWIDAQTGARHSASSTRDGVDLAPPEGGDDWILQLTR